MLIEHFVHVADTKQILQLYTFSMEFNNQLYFHLLNSYYESQFIGPDQNCEFSSNHTHAHLTI